MVELLPHGPVAPRGLVAVFRVPRIQFVQQVDVRIRGHRPQGAARLPEPLVGVSLAVVSLPWTALAPQRLQRHLCVPAPVLPLRFMDPPHAGRFIVFISTPREQ